MNFSGCMERRRAAVGVVVFLTLLASVGCQRADELGPVANAATAAKIRVALSRGEGGEEAPEKAAASTGTGWATLKGRFVYDGTPPRMAPYPANKDLATCAPGGKAPLQETLLVDEQSKGIANVAVYVRKVSRVHPSAQPATEKLVYDQKVCRFVSHMFPITIGQTMEIKNSDNVGHNTNIEGKNGFNQTIPAGQSIDFQPQKEEAVPVPVRCSIHPWMLGYLLPRKNAYYAVTTPDGSFEIANLPASEELEIQVWHESATGPGGALVLNTPEAKQLKWSGKGRFKLKLAPDQVQEIEITVPASAFGG